MLARSILCAVLLAQPATFTQAPVYVTAIDVLTTVTDSNGNMPRNLKPEDFIILEDGKEVPIIGVDYLDEIAAVPASAAPAVAGLPAENEWQTVLYFDLTMTSPQHRNLMVETLSKRAEELTRMGTVEIVTANPVAKMLLEGSRDPEEVRTALKKVSRIGTSNWIISNRRIFLHEMDSNSDVSATRRIAGAINSAKPATVLSYVVQEAELVSRFQRNLFAWISRYPRHVPRALVLVSDGFELDPIPFYAQNSIDNDAMQQIRSELDRRHLVESNAETGELLAAAGWSMFSVAGNIGADQADDPSRSAFGRVQEFAAENPSKIESAFLGTGASASLQQLAWATGGSVLNSGQAGQLVQTLAQRVKLTYQVSRPPDGQPRAILIRSRRPDLKVRGARFAASTTPDDVAAQRVTNLLRGQTEIGDLPIETRIEWRTDSPNDRVMGTLYVKVPLAELAPILRDSKPAFRVTFAAKSGPTQFFTAHRIATEFDRESMTFAWHAPITAANRKVHFAVSVEEMTTGAWGASTVETRVDAK